MNREFKFRVWESLNKEMHYLDFALYKFSNDSSSHKFVLPLNRQSFLNPYTIMNLEAVEIMQYIGLNDIHNKDIYEGDIVKIYKEVDNLTFTGKVIFKDASFAVQNDFFTGYCWQDYEVEVIGNIFENNDLWKYE